MKVGVELGKETCLFFLLNLLKKLKTAWFYWTGFRLSILTSFAVAYYGFMLLYNLLGCWF